MGTGLARARIISPTDVLIEPDRHSIELIAESPGWDCQFRKCRQGVYVFGSTSTLGSVRCELMPIRQQADRGFSSPNIGGGVVTGRFASQIPPNSSANRCIPIATLVHVVEPG